MDEAVNPIHHSSHIFSTTCIIEPLFLYHAFGRRVWSRFTIIRYLFIPSHAQVSIYILCLKIHYVLLYILSVAFRNGESPVVS